MLTNNMEVEYSLDDFAKALAANGYINDDSCFADIPSMLSAFDTADVLASPDSFPDSPCSNDDLSRVLEMAQIASPSLLDSCLSDNFPYSKPFQPSAVSSDSDSCKTRDPCIANVVLNESLQNLSTALSCKDTSQPKDVPLVQSIGNDAVSLDFNLLDAKENGILDNTSIPLTNTNPHSSPIPASASNSTSYSKEHLHHHQDSSHQHPLQQQVPMYLASSSESVTASTEPETPEPPASAGKQKRKRKSKGYSRPAKSKKKTSKNNTETSNSQPKPKPQRARTSKESGRSVSKDSDKNTSGDTDLPQDDSGFESGEKIPSQAVGVWERTSHASATTSSETAVEETEHEANPRPLRRSSRTTRNTENYNFRLSSLVKRVETERRQQEPRPPKDKAKPPPLSKYRRRTANARERDRMREINDAFDKLKDSLPNAEKDNGKQKATKFTILKMALNYIASLREMLGYEAFHSRLEDDTSSDSSSVRPASVTSSGSEDSCSSPTTAQSGTDHQRGSDRPTASTSLHSDHIPDGSIHTDNPATVTPHLRTTSAVTECFRDYNGPMTRLTLVQSAVI